LKVYARFCGRLEVKFLRPTRQVPGQTQDFLSAHSMIYGHFRLQTHLMAAAAYRRARTKAFRIWRQETCADRAV
jgi:hypothetical protein